MTSLFDASAAERLRATAPLAQVLRPRSLDEVVGQSHLVGPGAPLRKLVEAQRLSSMILWGPAGTGKTTLARLLAQTAGYHAEALSATSSGAKEVREVIERAKQRLGERGQLTVLFIDEVHRFSKSQQDLLLPATEAGEITLIGATTENPYFEVNAALLSRTTLWRLHSLTTVELTTLVERGVALRGVTIEDEAVQVLVATGDGDARSVLTTLDTAVILAGTDVVTKEHIGAARDGRILHQNADSHYDQVSALIKSIRGSDPDAAAYWLVAMLEAGESARFLARRLVISASEDIGLADSSMLTLAESCARAVEFVGLPEARYALMHTTLALALAPKSNSATRALAAASAAVLAHGAIVPAHLRDAHYSAAAVLGHGRAYLYPHDFPQNWVAQQYLPDELVDVSLFEAGETGAEVDLVATWRRRTDATVEGTSTVE